MFQLNQFQINIMNIIFYILMIVANHLSTGKILHIAKNVHSQFVMPKNSHFIWFFIYFLQLVYLIYSFFPSIKNSKVYVKTVGYMFSVICLLNILIVLTFSHKLMVLCLICYILIALACFFVYYNLQHIQKTYINLSTSVNYLCCELLFYIYLAWTVIVTFWMIFVVHKFYSGKLTCDGWVIFVIIFLTVVYLFGAIWRHEPIKLWVLTCVLCASAHHSKKGHKSVQKTACVCMWITFVVAIVITLYNLFVIIRDYVKSYKESRQILVK